MVLLALVVERFAIGARYVWHGSLRKRFSSRDRKLENAISSSTRQSIPSSFSRQWRKLKTKQLFLGLRWLRLRRTSCQGGTKMREKKPKCLNRMSLLFFAGLLCWPAPTLAQFHPKDTEWPSYAADLAGTRYRPLDQINASNFNDLEIAWRIKTDNFGDRPEYKLEGTPLMVNGVLYATAGSRRAVIAVDPATGELLWIHGEHEGKRGGAAPRQLSGRGLAYWSDGKEERIFYVTPGYRISCLDANHC